MDFALRPVIGQAKITGAATVTSQTGAFLATAAVLDGHYWYAPLLKRVHFVVKTDGFATLGGRTTTRRNIIPLPMVLDTNTKAGVGIATGNVATTNPEFNVIASAMTIDKYVEAGQMYSFSVSGGFGKTDDGTVYTNLLTTSTVYQEAATVSFAFNLDRSLSKIAATTIAASSAVLQLYPVAVSGFAADTGAGGVTPAVYAYPQDISRSRVYYWDSGVTTGNKAGFQEFGSNTVTVTPVGGGSSVTLTASQGTGTGVIATSATAPIYNPTSFDNNDNVVSAGSYSLTFSQPSAASATFTPGTAGGTAVAAAVFAAVEACYHYIPSGSITAAPGVITDIMVFGAASCFTPVQFTTGQKTTVGSSATGNPTSDQSKLTLKAVVRQSAAASAHSPFSSTSSRSVADVAVAGAEVPLYNGAAASSVSILFAVVMAFIAALAF